MEHIRIAIRDSTDSMNICFLDNKAGIKFHEATLQRFLKGTCNFLTLKFYGKDIDTIYPGCRLAFRYGGNDYWLTINSFEKNGYECSLTAYSLSLETNKEKRKAYKAPKWTFKQYLDYVDPEHSLTLGLNEVASQSMQLEWSGTDTILARLFSIANSFGAELEFVTELNDDYSLKRHVLNVYKVGNIGKDKTGMPIRVGKSLKVINYTANIDELYTAIRVHGKDGLTIAGLDKKVYDSDKKLLYYTQGDTLYAPQARDRFPAIAHKASDSFICLETEDTEHSSKESLYAYMLGELKKHSEPKIDYETEGYVDGQIGDRMLLIDSVHYDPPLYVEARISEQTISMLDKSKNKTVFANYERKKSEIANELLAKMNSLIEENKVYDVQIMTSNGYSFKNGQGSTTLTARVMDGPRDITNEFSVNWYRETDLIGPDASITVQASSINEKVVYRIIAYKDGVERGRSELTLINVNDGLQGPQGPKGEQGEQGPAGQDGIPGKDGVGLKTTAVVYGLSNSESTQPTSWSTQVPTLTKGSYLWTRTTWAYTDNTTEIGYQKTYIARDGNNGTDGLPGKDGVGISSTTITYATSISGTVQPTSGWSSQVPSVPSGQYLWTKIVWTYTDNTSETGYSVAKMGERGPQGLQGIQGPKGDQGIAGTNGIDGRTSYTHIAYADSADGSVNFSVSDSNRKYIGVYVDFNKTDSTNPSSYQWSLIKGADGQDGADGLPGKPGADGRTPYFHTAYADSADGQLGFSTTNASGKLYMGTCTDYIQSDPTDYRAYTWVKIKGETGQTGPAGRDGRDGKGVKSYAITYQAGTSGVAYPTGSWSSTIPNVPNGQYLWSKTTLTYTDNTTSDTYSVAYFPVNGATGATGNGISSYTAEFYLSTSKATQSGGSWGTTPPAWENGKYLWTRYKIGYTNGSTAYTTPHCSSEWEAVNEIKIPSDNLLSKTDTSVFGLDNWENNGSLYSLDNTVTYQGRPTIKIDFRTGSGGIRNAEKIELKPNTYYYYSATLMSDVDIEIRENAPMHMWLMEKATGLDGQHSEISAGININNLVANKWTVVTRYFKTPDKVSSYFMKPFLWGLNGCVLYVADLQIREGNQYIPWSPSSKDSQLQIDQANINISNKVDQNAYNTDQITIWDSINSKMDDAEFREFQSAMNALKSSYEGFVGEGGRYEKELQNAAAREQKIVQNLGAQVQQLDFINTYIRESEEGIVIGAKNNPMQMLLSKDSLSFMDGGQVVAYFSNQSFYINRGAVVESLQVGVHKLTKIDNNHTVIQYIPQ
ncbi:phage tail protein [Enterococcus cecorum]